MLRALAAVWRRSVRAFVRWQMTAWPLVTTLSPLTPFRRQGLFLRFLNCRSALGAEIGPAGPTRPTNSTALNKAPVVYHVFFKYRVLFMCAHTVVQDVLSLVQTRMCPCFVRVPWEISIWEAETRRRYTKFALSLREFFHYPAKSIAARHHLPHFGLWMCFIPTADNAGYRQCSLQGHFDTPFSLHCGTASQPMHTY